MEWTTSQSAEYPAEIDTTSSRIYNYVRRGVTEETVETDSGTMTLYNFEELRVRKDEWALYLMLEQAQADIDYLNMITEA